MLRHRSESTTRFRKKKRDKNETRMRGFIHKLLRESCCGFFVFFGGRGCFCFLSFFFPRLQGENEEIWSASELRLSRKKQILTKIRGAD